MAYDAQGLNLSTSYATPVNASADSQAGGGVPIAVAGGWDGSAVDRARVASIFKNIAAVAVTAGTPQAVWTPATGKKFRLMGGMLSLSVAGEVKLIDNATEIMRTPAMAAGIGMALPASMGNGILSTTANNVLNADVSASGTINGFVFGTEE